jgi:hypothetical protein
VWCCCHTVYLFVYDWRDQFHVESTFVNELVSQKDRLETGMSLIDFASAHDFRCN